MVNIWLCQKWRSKTFPGIARAFAEQWSIQIAIEEKLLTDQELEIIGKDYLQKINLLTGGIRYKNATRSPHLEKAKKAIKVEPSLLAEVEQKEQALITFWRNR